MNTTKKVFLALFILLLLSHTCTASTKAEAIQSLESAQQLVEQNSFNKAVEEIQFALSRINELLSDYLVSYIPEPPKGYTIVSKRAQGLGQAGDIIRSFNGLSAVASYRGQNGSMIDMAITVGGVLGETGIVVNFKRLLDRFGSAEVKKVRIKGYIGSIAYDKEANKGTLALQVGEKTTLTVEGTAIESQAVLTRFAERVKLEELDSNF